MNVKREVIQKNPSQIGGRIMNILLRGEDIYIRRCLTWFKIRSSVLETKGKRNKSIIKGKVLCTLFIFYKNSFYKNHDAENRRKLKNYVRITPGSRSPGL